MPNMIQVSQAIARPARTGAQMVPAEIITELIDAFFYNFTDKQYAAVFGALTLVIGWIQVLVENKSGKAFLRTVAVRTAPLTSNDTTPPVVTSA